MWCFLQYNPTAYLLDARLGRFVAEITVDTYLCRVRGTLEGAIFSQLRVNS